MAWAGFAKCLGARTVVSHDRERARTQREGKEEEEGLTESNVSPIFTVL
jgi:hypothetical protein